MNISDKVEILDFLADDIENIEICKYNKEGIEDELINDLCKIIEEN